MIHDLKIKSVVVETKGKVRSCKPVGSLNVQIAANALKAVNASQRETSKKR